VQAVEGNADAVIFDLEDGVVPDLKKSARKSVADFLSTQGAGWVRINDVTTEFWSSDLDALRGSIGLGGVILSKCESPEQVEATAERLGGKVPVIALVESALGVEHSYEIASSASAVRLAFGSGDFRRDTGAGIEAHALAYARGRLVVASRAAGIAAPIDGPTLSDQVDVLVEDLHITRSMGMSGKLCMREIQTASVNRELCPSAADVAWARETIEALGYDGARVRDGSDLPRLARARKIQDLATVFAQFDYAESSVPVS